MSTEIQWSIYLLLDGLCESSSQTPDSWKASSRLNLYLKDLLLRCDFVVNPYSEIFEEKKKST